MREDLTTVFVAAFAGDEAGEFEAGEDVGDGGRPHGGVGGELRGGEGAGVVRGEDGEEFEAGLGEFLLREGLPEEGLEAVGGCHEGEQGAATGFVLTGALAGALTEGVLEWIGCGCHDGSGGR